MLANSKNNRDPVNSVFSQKKKKTEDRRIFNFSITFSRILIEPPFSISSRNFAGHRRIRFFHGKRIEMDWFRRYVPGFRLRSSTISKLEYIIVSRSKSNRVERNVIFLRQPMRKQVASEAPIPDFRQPLVLSSQLLPESRPSIEWIHCEKLVENPLYDREIWSYSPLEPVRISENCAEDEKSFSFSPRVAPRVPKKNMETARNWQFIRARKLINWNHQIESN